ncbi:phosphohistidine phosphatase SixA [Leptolyngbya sp. FACHB-541]|nr:phosphohistidine phosphatase SixA [Leptolyngbya sp. FACHB-541]
MSVTESTEPTELYLIRHGIAAERGTYQEDSDRPLTEVGRHKTTKVAERLYELGVRFDLILTSPLVRTKQTAKILQSVGLSDRLEESDDLAPEGDFAHWLTWLNQWQAGGARLALVGHQPDLGDWAETLIWGESKQQVVLKKAGVIGLLLPEAKTPVGQSQLFWLTPPKFLL